MKVRTATIAGIILGSLFLAGSASAGEDGASYYAGFQAGYAWGGDDRVGLHPPGTDVGMLSQNGGLGGVFVGSNWRRKSVIWSLEAEFLSSSVGDRSVQGGYTSSTQLESAAGLRLRLGYPQKDYLPYVAGGLSVGWFDYRVSGGGVDIAARFSTPGYSLGAGWERSLGNSWSYRVEYRYTAYSGVTLESGGYSTKATPLDKSIRLSFVRGF